MSNNFVPTHFYYDIVITHDDINYGYKSSPAIYSVNNTQPIIDKPSEFFVSIIRFSIDGQSIPINVFRNDLSMTLYDTITQQAYQQNVVYVQNDLGANQNDEDYYFIYSYQHIIRMFNTALENAWIALNAGGGSTLAFAPYFIYNASTELFSIVTPYNNIANGNVQIYFNTPAFEDYLGIGFDVFKLSTSQDMPFGMNFRLNTIAYPGNTNAYAFPGGTIPAPPANPDALIFTQEYRSLSIINSFKNLIFATASLPVIPNAIPSIGPIPVPNLGNEPETGNGSDGSVNPFFSITDFEPILQNAGDVRQQLQYYPQGPYRYAEMLGDSALTKLDIRLFWEDKKGKVYPHNITLGQMASIKLLFRRKSSLTVDEYKDVITRGKL